ncbi:heterokaryon incompatibility protein-domain-containing protein [Cubamyces lactineus]|nr:heterokaryon incompatibility protein-domain-containing protein [Cubamyces lactineus]
MALPPRPRSICRSSWKGVFAAHFGLLSSPAVRVTDRDGSIHWKGGYAYQDSPAATLECSRSGCLWCQFLVKHFERHFELALSRDHPVHIRVAREAEDYIDADLVVILNGQIEGWFELYTTEDDPAARWIQRRTRITHVGAPHVLAMARTCVEECARTHTKCEAITSYPKESAPLPTRVIDCSSSECLRLVQTNDNVRGPYIALSYVWGPDGQPHRTTSDNLSSYMARIDEALLPQTIRDAIHVTRALGIQFLWVDSLCIIQDSRKDMHHELAQMRNVYRCAYLTIDAGSAASVTEGFLQERDPVDADGLLPFICPSRDLEDRSTKSARVGKVYMVRGPQASSGPHFQHSTVSDSGHGSMPPTSHTVTRGWCLQERLLSTRALVFTSNTLQLRCHTLTQNIGGARHDDDFDIPRLPDITLQPSRQVPRGSSEWKEIHNRWWGIVRAYSGRSLSDPSDKLIALSGLAEMFALALGPNYVAGLWRDTLLRDLLWHPISTSSPTLLRPQTYRAPSWSWASLDDQVSGWLRFPDHPDDVSDLADVVECAVTLQDESLPFGPVVGGSLILMASLVRCRWAGFDECSNGRVEAALHPSSCSPPGPEGPRATSELFRVCNEDRTLQETWFIPLRLEHGDLAVWGLVVAPGELNDQSKPREVSQGCERDAYRRVGLCVFGYLPSETLSTVPQLPRLLIELA